LKNTQNVKISIITPSLNQGQYIEDALLSVMKQDYKPLEHIVVDGASIDNTINVLRHYEKKYPLNWISRPDGGQSEALNQGLSIATGDIIGWLNADDMYMPKVFEYIAAHFKNRPDTAWLYGNTYWTDESRCVLIQRKPGPFDLKKLICRYQYMDQPSVFFRRHVPEMIGGIDNQLHYTMDYDFIIRMGIRFPGDYINKSLSAYRLHTDCKLMSQQTGFGQDALNTLDKTFSNPDLPNHIRRSKKQAYSYCYFLWGSKLLAAGHDKIARQWLINALKLDPSPWKPKTIAAIVALMDMHFQVNRYKPLEFSFKRQQRKFRHRHKNMRINWIKDSWKITHEQMHRIKSSKSCYNDQKIPSLLMIDSTPIGHPSATGQLKSVFLKGWPKSKFFQIWQSDEKNPKLHAISIGQSIEGSQKNILSIDDVLKLILAFSPDVIYFRPIESELLFNAIEIILQKINIPLIIHMMDDWPERLRITDPAKYNKLDNALCRLLDRASRRLSICQAMSEAYQRRYGGEWLPLGNGVDLAEFSTKDWAKRPLVSQKHPFLIRYMGGLADDMTYASVREIAETVSIMQSTRMIRLEIYTMDWCRLKAEQDIGKLPGVSVYPLVPAYKYRHFLSEADALVIAYNFDPKSISYIGLSLSNKMPECLASGAPVIVYGPPEVATIRYLKEAGCVQLIDQRDRNLLSGSIKALVDNLQLCRNLGIKGRAYVEKKHSKQFVQRQFSNYICNLNRADNLMI